MNKNLKRIVAALLGVMMAGSVFVGCSSTGKESSSKSEGSSSKQEEQSSTGEEAPEGDSKLIAPDGGKLSIYTGIPVGAVQSGMTSLSEHSVVKQMEKETGITFSFVHPPEGDDGTFFNTTIASGQYPDIFNDGFGNYPGNVVAAINDGVLISMNDLIEKHAPNYLAKIESKGTEVAKNMVSDTGEHVRFGSPFNDEALETRQHTGLVMRKDWLEELGLQPPRTIDELTSVLLEFKDKKGATDPFAVGRIKEWIHGHGNAIAGTFGVMNNGYQVDENGKVFYSRVQEGYKEYLTLMNDWLSKGIITRDYVNRTLSDANKLLYSGKAGMAHIGNWETREAIELGKLEDPNFDLIGIQFPRKSDPEAPYNLGSPNISGTDGTSWHISSACKDPELAIKFLDYLYLPETQLLTTWGVGDLGDGTRTFDEVDGRRVFSDFINNNPEMPFNTFRFVYTLQNFMIEWDAEMQRQQYNAPQNEQCWVAWSYNTDGSGKVHDTITLTADEAKTFAKNKTKMDTYGDEMTYKFILGDEPLDKFGDFVKALEGMGLAENVAIQQAAEDRWKQR